MGGMPETWAGKLVPAATTTYQEDLYQHSSIPPACRHSHPHHCLPASTILYFPPHFPCPELLLAKVRRPGGLGTAAVVAFLPAGSHRGENFLPTCAYPCLQCILLSVSVSSYNKWWHWEHFPSFLYTRQGSWRRSFRAGDRHACTIPIPTSFCDSDWLLGRKDTTNSFSILRHYCYLTYSSPFLHAACAACLFSAFVTSVMSVFLWQHGAAWKKEGKDV